MDYSKAAGIRKQSLLSLIAENKFENGQTVGASIKGAFTDKAKAKWTGYKEKLDPLNWVKGMTGNGVFGKSIRTLAGRAMGKTDEEISYFGGYSRNKKNPHYTTIGAGRIQNLRVGDSIADVLGKMYNFMLKNAEREKLNYEIEKAFREEQTEEDGRRHDALIKSIKDYMKGKATLDKPPEEEKEKGKGFWEEIIDGAAAWGAKLLSNLWNAIKFVAELLAGDWLAKRIRKLIARPNTDEQKGKTNIPKSFEEEVRKTNSTTRKEQATKSQRGYKKEGSKAAARNQQENNISPDEKKQRIQQIKSEIEQKGGKQGLRKFYSLVKKWAAKSSLKAGGVVLAGGGPLDPAADVAAALMIGYDGIQLYSDMKGLGFFDNADLMRALIDDLKDSAFGVSSYDTEIKKKSYDTGVKKKSSLGLAQNESVIEDDYQPKSLVLPKNNIPTIKSPIDDLGLASNEQVIEINNVNTVGNKSEHQDLTPIDPRNNNESYEQCVRRGAVGC